MPEEWGLCWFRENGNKALMTSIHFQTRYKLNIYFPTYWALAYSWLAATLKVPPPHVINLHFKEEGIEEQRKGH